MFLLFFMCSFVIRTMEVENTMLTLMEYASSGDDPCSTSITVQQLESFICRLIPLIDRDHDMHESFHEFFAYTASQKFLFYLDAHRRNCLSIKHLAHHWTMQELLILCRQNEVAEFHVVSYVYIRCVSVCLCAVM
jgi:hypothetical protein